MTKYVPALSLSILGLVVMYFSLKSDRIWIWIVFCVGAAGFGLCASAYRIWRIPSEERGDKVRWHIQNFRDYMSGKHDPKS